MENIKYIRIQSNLHGLYTNENEDIILPLKRDTGRNTLHFAINSVVTDHNMGKFNYDKNGNFKGKIAIISDPSELPLPSGLKQVDTWFRLENTYNPNSEKEEKGLNIGKSIIVAPTGTELPKGVKAIFYDGTIENRNYVISEYFKENNIKLNECGEKKWIGFEGNEHEWEKEQAKKVYGELSKFVSHDLHMNTLDNNLEDNINAVKNKLAVFKKADSRIDESNFLSNYYIDNISNKIDSAKEVIKSIRESLPESEKNRLSSIYNKIDLELDNYLKESLKIDDVLKSKNELIFLDDCFDNITNSLGSLPGKGDFYYVKEGSKNPILISEKDLANNLLINKITENDKIWREGLSNQWSPISSYINLNDFNNHPTFKSIAKTLSENEFSEKSSFYILKEGSSEPEKLSHMNFLKKVINKEISDDSHYCMDGFKEWKKYSESPLLKSVEKNMGKEVKQNDSLIIQKMSVEDMEDKLNKVLNRKNVDIIHKMKPH